MASSAVFLDTNGWLALLNASDTLHPSADAAWRELGRHGREVVVTDWVVAETGNGLARTQARHRFAGAVRVLRASARSRLVFATEDLLAQALDLYASRPDKTWGLVDCLSITVMGRDAIREVFSNDRHFEQAGFRCLLS